MHQKSFATTTCNHMHVLVATPRLKALLKFLTFASESDSCASELDAPHGPHRLEACLALCVGPQWPELANPSMLGVVVSMCGHCAMHLVAHCQVVLVC